MRIRFILLILLFPVGIILAGEKDSINCKYSETISASDLKKHLYIIASPEYEGRETGMEGQKKAATYLMEEFKKYGLAAGNNGSYFQEFPLIVSNPHGVKFSLDGSNFELGKDFSYYLTEFKDTSIYADILFLGYGINDEKYDDFKNIEVKNKLLLILDGEPRRDGNYLITNSNEPSEWTVNYRKKINTAYNHGAAGVLIIKNSITDNLKHMMDKNRMKLDKTDKTDKSIYALFITREVGAQIIGNSANKQNLNTIETSINQTYKSKKIEIKSKAKIEIKSAFDKIKSENVLAYIEGSDLKDELIILTAHYDHLGVKDGEIYVGADDDGSGTVALLEIAEAFAKAKKEGNGPRRSILFMPVSGEEKGLLGSEYYSENPVFSLANTVVNLNIDMIGRIDDKHILNPDYIYLIGSDKLSTDLHKISETVNNTYVKLKIDYTFNQPEDPNRFYYRSDHYNFAKHNVPIIFYFNGTHADYHKSSDTPDKINYELMEKRVKLVFFTAWELANRDERIKVDVSNDFKNEN